MARAIVPDKPTVHFVQGRLWTRRCVWAACWLLLFSPIGFVAFPERTWRIALATAFISFSLLALLLRLVERPRQIREVRSLGRIPIIR